MTEHCSVQKWENVVCTTKWQYCQADEKPSTSHHLLLPRDQTKVPFSTTLYLCARGVVDGSLNRQCAIDLRSTEQTWQTNSLGLRWLEQVKFLSLLQRSLILAETILFAWVCRVMFTPADPGLEWGTKSCLSLTLRRLQTPNEHKVCNKNESTSCCCTQGAEPLCLGRVCPSLSTYVAPTCISPGLGASMGLSAFQTKHWIHPHERRWKWKFYSHKEKYTRSRQQICTSKEPLCRCSAWRWVPALWPSLFCFYWLRG